MHITVGPQLNTVEKDMLTMPENRRTAKDTGTGG
jgi:hypothetical protein